MKPVKIEIPDFLKATEPLEWDVVLRTSTPPDWNAEQVKRLFTTIVHDHAVVMRVKKR